MRREANSILEETTDFNHTRNQSSINLYRGGNAYNSDSFNLHGMSNDDDEYDRRMEKANLIGNYDKI
jgi:hypothetical protein